MFKLKHSIFLLGFLFLVNQIYSQSNDTIVNKNLKGICIIPQINFPISKSNSMRFGYGIEMGPFTESKLVNMIKFSYTYFNGPKESFVVNNLSIVKQSNHNFGIGVSYGEYFGKEKRFGIRLGLGYGLLRVNSRIENGDKLKETLYPYSFRFEVLIPTANNLHYHIGFYRINNNSFVSLRLLSCFRWGN